MAISLDDLKNNPDTDLGAATNDNAAPEKVKSEEEIKREKIIKGVNMPNPVNQSKKDSGEYKAVSINDMLASMPKKENEEPPKEEDIFGNALYSLEHGGLDRAKQDMYEHLIKPALEHNAKIEEENAKIIEEAQLDAEVNGTEIPTPPINVKPPINLEPNTTETITEDSDIEKDLNVELPEPPKETAKPKKEKPVEETSDDESKDFYDGLSSEEFEKLIGLDDNEEDAEDALSEDERKEEEEEDKKRIDFMKTEIKSMIKPIKKSIDLSNFQISSKPVSISKILNNAADTSKKTADWVMYRSGKSFSMTELSGTEIDKFNPNRSGRNNLNLYKERYSILYKHLIDDNKPATFEAWLKSIAWFDNDDLFFGAYKATFQDTNIVPYECNECKHNFMQNIPIDKMVKYPNDEVKNNVQKILNKDTTGDTSYKAKLTQVSDNLAFAIKTPSVYSVVMETAVLDNDFVERYAELLNTISYIDNIFYIDEANQTINPIYYKPDPKDFAQTTKRKIVTYAKMLGQLSSDQMQTISSEIMKIEGTDDTTITYVQPEVICPKCGAKIAEVAVDPINLLFIRHQLVRFSNT